MHLAGHGCVGMHIEPHIHVQTCHSSKTLLTLRMNFSQEHPLICASVHYFWVSKKEIYTTPQREAYILIGPDIPVVFADWLWHFQGM